VCDFFTADLLDGTQAYVLAAIEHATRRIRILGVTQHPTGAWPAQQARNLVMDLGAQAHHVKFMIRDHGSNFTAALDAILADAGIRTVLCNVRTPRMNAIAERWIGDAAANSWIAPSSGTRPICGGSCPVRNPRQSAPASPVARRRCPAETATRTGRSRPVPRPKHARVGGLINEYRLAA
jgi:transposase InsO family protein